MPLSRIELKMDAKAKIKAAIPPPYLTTLAYLIIMIIIGAINNVLNSRFDPIVNNFTNGITAPAFSNTLLYSMIFMVLLSLVSGFINVGYTWYALRISRGMHAVFSNLLDVFNLPLKIIGLSVMVTVFTLLWMLLLIVPGIIAAYSYRQAFYILHDNPDYSIMQCIAESKAMMKGHKRALFVLDLSFIGWQLLCVLTMGVLLIWILPYVYVTYANFFTAVNPGFAPGGEPFDE